MRAMDVVIDHLTKSYGDQKAVEDLSFTVKTGEILGFLGPNGAGKSTTMKTIASYLAIESGDVRIGNRSLLDAAESLKQHIGYLPENNPLYLEMPVIEYLEYCASLQGLTGLERSKRVREMIAVCGINTEKHKQIGELSKGYRQRVGLAQAMIHDPEILILDEPTTGLDPNQIVEIRQLIKDLGREKTVILSTHILPEVEATCDRILIINRGKIVADGTADALKQQASGNTMYTLQVGGVRAEKLTELLQGTDGVLAAETDPKSGGVVHVQTDPSTDFPKVLFDICSKHSWYIQELTPQETSLEDIFRGLTL